MNNTQNKSWKDLTFQEKVESFATLTLALALAILSLCLVAVTIMRLLQS